MSNQIFSAIPAIMSELGAVGRDKRNQQQNFNYRGIDDLYNALQPLLAKHSVFTVPEVIDQKRDIHTTKSGSVQNHVVLTIKYTFYAKDGSSFSATVVGEGMDSFDKASNKAESIAHKYALTQVFAVRTEDQIDPDGETPEERKIDHQPAHHSPQFDPNYVFQTGGPKLKNKCISDVPVKDIQAFIEYWAAQTAKGQKIDGPLAKDLHQAKLFFED